jgi:hypothetical protein
MTRGQFKPGKSGNAGGRPKVQADAARVLARYIQGESDGGVEFAQFCFAILRADPKLPPGRPAAAETDRRRTLSDFGVDPSTVTLEAKERAKDWLADRGLGKAMQFIDVTTDDEDGGELVPIDLSGLTLAELKDLKRRLKADDQATEDAAAGGAGADDGDEPDPPAPAAPPG